MPKGEPGLYVDYCAKDFLDGTQMLDPWEELAYRRICDMIYVTNDRLLDDDRKLAWATKTGRRWPAIKASLTGGEKPKLLIVDGRITNVRCQFALGRAATKIAQQVAAGSASAASGKSLKNLKQNRTDVREAVREPLENQTSVGYDDKTVQKKCSISQGTAAQEWSDNLLENLDAVRTDVRQNHRTEHRTTQITNKVRKKEEMPNGILSENGSARLSDIAVEMTKIWNEECGLFSRANKPNASRRGRCARAWRHEFGGSADQWRAYCRTVAASPHLRGENDRGWRADLDWVLKPENVSKIQEGRYAPRPTTTANGVDSGPHAEPVIKPEYLEWIRQMDEQEQPH